MVVLLDQDKANEIYDDLGFSPHNRIIQLMRMALVDRPGGVLWPKYLQRAHM